MVVLLGVKPVFLVHGDVANGKFIPRLAKSGWNGGLARSRSLW